MAEPKDEWYEDDACMNCGETEYRESQIPGLCIECSCPANVKDPDSKL